MKRTSLSTKLKRIAFIVFALYLVSNSTSQVLAWSSNNSVTVNITDAYYSDADDGGIEDDVKTKFKLRLISSEYDDNWDVWWDYYKVRATLILPSGLTFSYDFTFTRTPSWKSTMYFYNHATEPGWYTVIIECWAYPEAHWQDIVYGSDTLVFDPPGGDRGAEPLARMVI